MWNGTQRIQQQTPKQDAALGTTAGTKAPTVPMTLGLSLSTKVLQSSFAGGGGVTMPDSSQELTNYCEKSTNGTWQSTDGNLR
jgi:hypothetical protein